MSIAAYMKTEFTWKGRRWSIWYVGGSYFARCDGSDVGPYSTEAQAHDFITGVGQ